MTKVPISCTLTAADASQRVGEWQVALSQWVDICEQDGSTATLALRSGTNALLAAVDLAEREKACCPFFSFSIAIKDGSARLHIGVPAEATSLLTGLLSLGGSAHSSTMAR